MSTRRAFAIVATVVALGAAAAPSVRAQAQAGDSSVTPKTAFFDSETPLTATISTNIRQIRGDRKDGAPWRAATLALVVDGAAQTPIPLKLRTRGIWRLNNCEFPPIRLNFAKESVKGTLFMGLDKPKLVNICRNSDRFDQYVLQELQLYRVYHLLTPVSHKSRLMRVTYVDSASGRPHFTRWTIVLEEPDAMAERLGGTILDAKGALETDLEPETTLLFSLFQYLIANTDMSVQGLHNAELVMRNGDGTTFPVAYDFDFAGAVNTPYAGTDPRLRIRHVRQRLYRGLCASPEAYDKGYALFNAKKDAIYALYGDEIGRLLDADIRKETLEYFDEFYRTINDPKRANSAIADQCLWGKR